MRFYKSLISFFIFIFSFSGGYSETAIPENDSFVSAAASPNQETAQNLYPYVLEAIYQEEGEWKLLFDDGAVWRVKNVSSPEKMESFLQEWSAQDEVYIWPTIVLHDKGSFILKNRKTDFPLIAKIETGPTKPEKSLSIVKIDTNGYFLSLSDGSDWTLDWFSSLSARHWRLGDRLILNKGDKTYASYVLINIDHKKHTWSLGELTSWQ